METEYQSDAAATKDTPYLALTGELWGVFCEYLWENWPRYNGNTLYMVLLTVSLEAWFSGNSPSPEQITHVILKYFPRNKTIDFSFH